MSAVSVEAVVRLGPGDATRYTAMLDVFAEAFEADDHYRSARPGATYVERLLGRADFIALVAEVNGEVVGALAAYELIKFEQERSEIYIYDLAVRAGFRRRGVASALIERVREIARETDGWVVYVQADYGDEPAVALYTRLGVREDVMHFDIPV